VLAEKAGISTLTITGRREGDDALHQRAQLFLLDTSFHTLGGCTVRPVHDHRECGRHGCHRQAGGQLKEAHVPRRCSGRATEVGCQGQRHRNPTSGDATLRKRPGSIAGCSHSCAVVEVNHTALEAMFIQQFELHTYTRRERRLPFSDHDGYDEKVVLVDQPSLECLSGKFRTSQ
jgi:hypothetical protein